MLDAINTQSALSLSWNSLVNFPFPVLQIDVFPTCQANLRFSGERQQNQPEGDLQHWSQRRGVQSAEKHPDFRLVQGSAPGLRRGNVFDGRHPNRIVRNHSTREGIIPDTFKQVANGYRRLPVSSIPDRKHEVAHMLSPHRRHGHCAKGRVDVPFEIPAPEAESLRAWVTTSHRYRSPNFFTVRPRSISCFCRAVRPLESYRHGLPNASFVSLDPRGGQT